MTTLRSLCLGVLFAGLIQASAQSPLVLFEDDFERATPGLVPASDSPSLGTYAVTGTVNPTNEVRVLTGAYPSGPSKAASGKNYLMIDRASHQSANQVLNAIFSRGLFATNTPFHAELRLWAASSLGDNSSWPQVIVGGAIRNGVSLGADPSVHLLYTSFISGELAWKFYDGGYGDSGLRFQNSSWNHVEMDWDGKMMTGKLNGVSAPLELFGSSDKLVDRLVFRTSGVSTKFFIDDIKVTTSAAVLVQSVYPAPDATRRPHKRRSTGAVVRRYAIRR